MVFSGQTAELSFLDGEVVTVIIADGVILEQGLL